MLEKLKTRKHKTLSLIASTIVLALFATPLSAMADGGGGAGSGGSYTIHGRGALHYVFYDRISGGSDKPKQGVMTQSINYFISGALTNGASLSQKKSPTLHSAIFNACNTALNRAEARNPQGRNGKSRVVGLMWGSKPDTIWDGYAQILPSEVTDFYNQWRTAGAPGVLSQAQVGSANGYQKYLAYIEQGKNDAVNSMNKKSVAACIALNSNEPPQNYKLTITTDKAQTFTMVGDTKPVWDTIHASRNGSSIKENVTGTISLIWDSPEGQGKKKVDKKVTIANNGNTTSPKFTPADFGWDAWTRGTYSFDVVVPKQKKMANSVNTPDRDPRETWKVNPKLPSKELYKNGSTKLLGTNVLASGQAYDTRIVAHSNGYLSSMMISDTIHTADVFIGNKTKDDKNAVYVLNPNGKRVPATITIDRSAKNQVSVSASLTNLNTQGDYTLVVPTFTKPTGKDYTIKDTGKVCYTKTLKECLTTNEKHTQKVTPSPDKVWVLDETGALASQDKKWTNTVAADQKLFFHGDKVGAVVNGHIPAHLATPLSEYAITDDWSDAKTYMDFTDATKVSVYAGGENVTKNFTITVKDGITIATAKESFLKTTRNLAADKPMKLVITGKFKPVAPPTDTKGKIVVLNNKGSERYNNETKPTNIPPVFIWNPQPTKDVLSSAKQDGNQTSIDGQQVFPNQWIEYLINVDVDFPKSSENLAHPVDNFQVKDDYDPFFELDKTSIEFYDARTNKVISRKHYTLSFDDKNSSFTATFKQEWIDSQLLLKEKGDLLLRFDGKVAGNIEAGTTLSNQSFEIINKSVSKTNIPKVIIPYQKPDKEDLNKDLIDIDKKTVVGGETIMYRLTMDATPARDKLAYDVHKLGMIDDFDEKYLSLNTKDIKVVEKATGKDVTGEFNVQVDNGIAYIFAKLVDTTNQNGEIIQATQPISLKDYANKAIDPVNDPIIKQELLGKQYWVYLPTKVKKVTDGYAIENSALQNTENMVLKTRIVSNPENEITPNKDVTITVGGQSINKQEVKLNNLFNYRLTSSILPKNMAEKATQWSIVDDYDEVSDRYTGQWSAIAERDLYDGKKLIAKQGTPIDVHTGVSSENTEQDNNSTGLFTVKDEKGVLTVHATQKYLDLVNSRSDLEHGFSIYVQMERLVPGTVTNTFTETYNHIERNPEPVKTTTPENPAIDVEKWDTTSGNKQGDRDTEKEALIINSKNASAAIDITYTITNTGDVPLKNITLKDKTVKGDGKVESISCPNMKVLQPNAKMTCTSKIKGLKAGSIHTNTATVTGVSVYTNKQVTDQDKWNAKVSIPLLAKTGASVTGLAMIAVLTLTLGGVMLRFRNRKEIEA
ncbi:LPXTG cell wall anchor domain-containing protein [Enterococcus sp. AN402]|uniref:LPXTG cell wall anchor domain-containing protein n=1 Tax=Enterococcus sp. AN402 TaxID=3151386 RepID=UPI003459FE29